MSTVRRRLVRRSTPEKVAMNDTTIRSDELYTLQEALARARMLRAPRWRSLPYRPALQVAAGARRGR